jgi:hypothetical protein
MDVPEEALPRNVHLVKLMRADGDPQCLILHLAHTMQVRGSCCAAAQRRAALYVATTLRMPKARARFGWDRG